VGGEEAGLAGAVNIIVATSLEGFQQGALATVAQGDDGQIGVFRIGANHTRNVERSHFAHVGGANDCGRCIVFERSQRERGLSAAGNVETLAFERVAEAL